MKNAHSHYEQIVDQFSKQSVPFTKIQGHLDAIQTPGWPPTVLQRWPPKVLHS